MIHPDTELRPVSGELGLGVFATRRIPRGTLVWVRDELDQTFDQRQVEQLHPASRRMLARYAFAAADGLAVLCWDIARYVNHSCDPNCIGPALDVELAARDIEAGEELTGDYGLYGDGEPFTCKCGAPACRERVTRSDRDAIARIFDAMLPELFELAGRVEQPLRSVCVQREQLEGLLAKPRSVGSVSDLFCDPIAYARLCRTLAEGE